MRVATVVEESVSDQPDAFASIAPTDPGGIPGVYESAPLKTRYIVSVIVRVCV